MNLQYKLSAKYPQKRAFITGAASGIGKALAMELARDGWTLGICDINWERLNEVAKEIENAGGKALPYQLDVADKVRYKEVANEYLSQTLGIDLLFNNAGVGDGGFFEEYSLENWEWLLGINQMGVIYGCHYFIPIMKKQKSGHIVNTASAASFGGAPRMGTYCAAKAAVLSISETLYMELKDYQVNVSAIMPTFIRTNITQYSRNEEGKKMGDYMVNKSKITPEWLAKKVLQKMDRNKLYIIEPRESRILWMLTRFFPKYALKFVEKISKKDGEKALAEIKITKEKEVQN